METDNKQENEKLINIVDGNGRSYYNQQERHEDEDHELKKGFAKYLRNLLLIQTVLIFVLIFFQAFKFLGFNLNDYIFYILISGTLIESYFLVQIIVRHLFPIKKA